MNRSVIALFFLVIIGFGIRFPFIARFADSFDAVDFALGVVDFNVLAMQPHFPGYPVLILGAYVIHLWTQDPVLSLSLLSAVSGALLPVPVYILASRIANVLTGWMVAWLVSLNPLLWLYSLQPMSDMPGILLVYVALAFLALTVYEERGRVQQWTMGTIAVIAFGLAMGVRLSYFPFAAAFLLLLFLLPRSWKGYAVFLVAGIFSVSVWLLPTAYHEGGMIPYLQMGLSFTQGHFSEWGGTVVDSDLAFHERVGQVVGQYLLMMGAVGRLKQDFEGASWLLGGLFFAGLLLVYRSVQQKVSLLFFALLFVPYLSWSILAQNADKPRHILILVPLVLLVAVWLCKRKIVLPFILLLSLVYGWNGWHWAERYRQTIPPTIQLVDYIQDHYDPDDVVIYTWEEQRILHYYAPSYYAERLKSPAYFRQMVLMHANREVKVLLTSQVLEGFGLYKEELLPHLKRVTSFQESQVLYPTYHDITLYEGLPSLLPYLKSRD
ncbi:hypothetical protein [Ammoniphilus sp. YIM 78166]|uniref:hypothetical protein n=1 Tax=Ammoniphilus sp. YIM 78166 TaxID=1644106 RepID=UPI00106F7484|nr:hypothetical protein [Ammoniphilus sp. YIM 78166]